MSEASNATKPHVVIIGAGFAGINAARRLGKASVRVTVVDRKNHFTFQPLLYQVALAVLSPGDIAQPIRSVLRDNSNTEVIMDEVVSLDVNARRVNLKTGVVLAYDYLIVASGSTHSYFGKPEWAAVAPGLKTLEDAVEMRRRVLLAFELAERQTIETGSHPPLNFVIVGGGPTGVELAGAISDIARLYMTRDYRNIDTKSATVLILEGSPHLLGAYPPDLQLKALQQLNAIGVQVRTGAHVTDIQPGYVMVGDEKIESICTLWAAGVQASPLGKMIAEATGRPQCLDRRGCVQVDHFLNPLGHPEIFICGDLSHVEQDGHQVPGVAQPAIQMGVYAAKRIKLLAASPAAAAQQKPFRYFDKGDMATIGRKAAVARVAWPFHADLSGFIAWLMWLVIHISFLIGFRNRLSVLSDWAYTYIRFRDGVRLIVGSQVLPGWDALVEKPVPTAPKPAVTAPPA